MATLDKIKEKETINEDLSQSNNSQLNNNNDLGINTLNTLSMEFNSLTKKALDKGDNNKNYINTIHTLNNETTINNNYINELKDYYQRHINESYSNFRTCLNKLEGIARQNNNNKITASMLKEIIDDNLFYERERQIMNFIKEIKETQAQKEKIKNELKQNEINNISKKLEIELNKKKNYKKISRELTVTLEKKNLEINELQKLISIMEQEKKENSKSIQKKREEYEKLKKEYAALETQKIEIEIKFKNLIEEKLSLEKINQNYERDKKLLFQGLEEEKKKFKENFVRESGAMWTNKLKEKIPDIQNIKKLMITLKNEYKMKFNEFLLQYRNALPMIQEKIIEFDNQNKENIKKIEKKYEKHLNEQFLINNKLKRQNEELLNKKNEDNLDSQKMVFKINELQNENNNQKATIEKLKIDLDKKNKENTAINDKNLLLVKNVNNFLLMLTKLKKKYLSIIFTLKTQINNIKDLYVSDISRVMSLNNNNINNNINLLNNKVNQLQNENDELREINEKMQMKLNELIEENEQKNNNITQLNEELLIRQQKINNLHNVFNKSISSYSNGIKNIQIAQKLDNDVQELIEKAKNQMSTISNYNTENL